ncbi:MAG: GNAT family N-acetyltransferase [Oscillospiraceae bacterium]|nr:GNAT family N-acetyltransferase [Oscillospiraceae bacterium]
MFHVRPYQESDLADCAVCLYESFFTCPIRENDNAFLREYVQVLLEKCNFTLVAEDERKKVVGFISGKYSPEFDKKLASTYAAKKHYGVWCRMFFKFYLRMYKLSAPFKAQLDGFLSQLQQREKEMFGKCDLELVALCSRMDFRRGLGTALLRQFLSKAQAEGADTVRLFTNTLATYQFYDKRGLSLVASKPFQDGSANKSLVYEYRLKEQTAPSPQG